MDMVTYYRGEDIHPALEKVFEWADINVFRYLPEETTPILAGGALRAYFTGTPARDYDIYFPTQAKYAKCVGGLYAPKWRKLESNTKESTVYQFSQVGIDHSDAKIPMLHIGTYNFIHRKFYDTPADVIAAYDFVACMCGVSKDQISFHPDYFIDLQTRTLRINNIEDPLNTLWRVQKYNGYGFKMDQENMFRLVESIHDMPNMPNVSVAVPEQSTAATQASESVVTLADVFRSS